MKNVIFKKKGLLWHYICNIYMTIFYNNKTKCKLNANYKSIHHKYFINFINKKIKFLKTYTSNKIEILKYYYNNNCYHLIIKIHNI